MRFSHVHGINKSFVAVGWRGHSTVCREYKPEHYQCSSEKAQVSMAGQTGRMRAADHQFQQALVVGMMAKQGDKGVKYDVEGSGYGFRVILQLNAEQATRPTTCNMVRPG